MLGAGPDPALGCIDPELVVSEMRKVTRGSASPGTKSGGDPRFRYHNRHILGVEISLEAWMWIIDLVKLALK